MTAKGFELGGKYANDPIGSEKPRGKDTYRRKSARDPGLTPTEQRQKNELMRQFMTNPEGGGIGNSKAYRESAVWCQRCNGRRMNAPDMDTCMECAQ